MRWLWAALAILPLSGCAMPSGVNIASFAVDSVSYVLSGKTVLDHGISLVADQDCALSKALEGRICEEYLEYPVALATLEPLPYGEDYAALPKPVNLLAGSDYLEDQIALSTVRNNDEAGLAAPVFRAPADSLLGDFEYLADGAHPGAQDLQAAIGGDA